MSAPRVVVDPDVCMGSGTCVYNAPATFALDDESGVARVIDPAGDPIEDVLGAAYGCPTQAITVEEAG
jgi:ferredoxin